VEKSEAKDGKLSVLFPNFSPHRPTFPFFFRRVSIVVATTTHMSVFPTPPGMPPITLCLRPDKIPPPHHPHPHGGHYIILHAHGKIISMVVRPVQRPCGLGPNLFRPNHVGWAGSSSTKKKRAGLLGRLSAQLDSAGSELDGWAGLAKFI